MYNWKNNPNLSSKTDSDYTSDVIDVLTSELSKTPLASKVTEHS